MILCTCLGFVMRAISSQLLCFLSVLVEVYSQIAPYLTFMGNNISNNSYLNLNRVGLEKYKQEQNTLHCNTDLSACCSGAQGPDRGDWYFPNGNRLPFYNYINIPVLSELRGLRQVVVYYRGSDGISGIYRCDIETIAVNNNSGNVSIFVGLYIHGGE